MPLLLLFAIIKENEKKEAAKCMYKDAPNAVSG